MPCTRKQGLAPCNDVQTSVVVQIDNLYVVQSLMVNLAYRPSVVPVVPKPYDLLVHQTDDVIFAITIDICHFEICAELPAVLYHIFAPTRVFVPHKPASIVPADYQVDPAIAIHITDCLTPWTIWACRIDNVPNE